MEMKTFPLFGGIVLAAGLSMLVSSAYAQSSLPAKMVVSPKAVTPYTGRFSDTQLTPNTVPTGAIGNDLLLAESIMGPRAASPPYPALPAESWTTQVEMELNSDTQNGVIDPSKAALVTDSFSGSGPTGTYAAGTIGGGKHTENTIAIAKQYFTSPALFMYVYIFQYIAYDRYGNRVVTKPQTQQGSYSL